MNAVLIPWILSYLLNALWQVPLVFAAAWLTVRMLRCTAPRVEHRVWVAALLLELMLPACDLRLGALRPALRSLLSWLGHSAVDGGHISTRMGPGVVNGAAERLPAFILFAVVLVYACSVLYFVARLCWGLWRTYNIARAAVPAMLTHDAALCWQTCNHRLATPPPPKIALSPQVPGPVTVGFGQGILLLPEEFLERVSGQDLEAVFAHELAHIARRDFAKNLLYSVAAVPIDWHPLLWRTRSHLAESRELVCDAIAAQAIAGRKQYARSLLRLAATLSLQPRVPAMYAIGILNGNTDEHTLERRVMTLTHKSNPMSAGRRLLLTAACGVLALTTCVSALALHMNMDAPASTPAQTDNPAKRKVESGVMAGQKISGNTPVYPLEAKVKRVQGTVVLSMTIDTDGVPKDLKVQTSPDDLLSESAMDAIRTWRYSPYLVNGEPVEVETTVNVVYSLGG